MPTFYYSKDVYSNKVDGFSKTIINGAIFSNRISFLQFSEILDITNRLYIVSVPAISDKSGIFYASTEYNLVKQFLEKQKEAFVLALEENLYQIYGFEKLVLDLKEKSFWIIEKRQWLDFHFSRFLHRHGLIRSPIIIANFLEEFRYEYFGGIEFLKKVAYESCLYCLLYNIEITQYFKTATETYFTDPIGLFSRKLKMLPKKYLKGVRFQFIKEYIKNNPDFFEEVFYASFKYQNVLLHYLGINKMEFRHIIKDVFGVSPYKIYLQFKLNKAKIYLKENDQNVTQVSNFFG